MKYTLTIPEEAYRTLTQHLFKTTDRERAAYLLCKLGNSPDETRLLAHKVIPVQEEHIISSSRNHMKISNRSFLPLLKHAHNTKTCFVWVHSHPQGLEEHSSQDDAEESKLFRTAYTRIRHDNLVHASLVFPTPETAIGRAWLPGGTTVELERIRVIGRRFSFHFANRDSSDVPEVFDRQVRAFGKGIQAVLGKLHVGIVGAGGTGSAVAEQLIRLGVGKITAADGESFEDTNINRVYGSRIDDHGRAKVDLIQRQAETIGLGTEVNRIDQNITDLSAFKKLLSCDVVFGCTDDEWGRSLLTRLAVYYYIPVFDMGVKIDSKDGKIRSIQGRVSTLLPPYPCLYCRGRITPERVRAESMKHTDPEQAAQLRQDGYAPELEEPAPAVIAFTTMVAAGAVTELLQRLTGFMGPDRNSSETLFRIDQTAVSTIAHPPRPDCFCQDPYFAGRGDVSPLMDSTWPEE